MPRTSEKQRAARRLEKTTKQREELAEQRFLYGIADAAEDDVDDYYLAELERIQGKRYYVRKPKYRKREPRWENLLHDHSYLSDKDFLAHFRVTRSAF
jgi:hypothetical protein